MSVEKKILDIFEIQNVHFPTHQSSHTYTTLCDGPRWPLTLKTFAPVNYDYSAQQTFDWTCEGGKKKRKNAFGS